MAQRIEIPKGYATCACGNFMAFRSKRCRECADAIRAASYLGSPCKGQALVPEDGEGAASPSACGIRWRHSHCACGAAQSPFWTGLCGLCVAESMGLGRIVPGQGGTPAEWGPG